MKITRPGLSVDIMRKGVEFEVLPNSGVYKALDVMCRYLT